MRIKIVYIQSSGGEPRHPELVSGSIQSGVTLKFEETGMNPSS